MSLALVAYGSSDESEPEESGPSRPQPQPQASQPSPGLHLPASEFPPPTSQPPRAAPKAAPPANEQLFASLPSPTSTFSIPDNTFKLLNKKQPVKIVIPSLSEIQMEDEEVKVRKPSTKGSGLFALLPAPKNVTSLVPNAVKNTPKPTKLVPKKPIRNPFKKVASSSSTKSDDEDDENIEKPESFFFNSIEVKPDEIEPVDIPNDLGKSQLSHSHSPSVSSGASSVVNRVNEPFGPETESSSEVWSNDSKDISEEAIEKLCGVGAKKRKGGPDDIIDINVDSMVGDAYMWLSKDLTTEQEHTGFKKPKNLSVVERRKHQITYLASQAKEKEMELRNQWANSRLTRKQTQSKYGF